ncbi:unnamed protein product, partial [Laminaria digitata]
PKLCYLYYELGTPPLTALRAWLAKTRRVPSGHCRDATVYGHTTTATHDNEYTPAPPNGIPMWVLTFPNLCILYKLPLPPPTGFCLPFLLNGQGEPEGENLFSEFPHVGFLEGKKRLSGTSIFRVSNKVDYSSTWYIWL